MTAKTQIDELYYWKGLGDGFGTFPSCCRVRVFYPHPEQTVVILSDSGNGASITNSIEYILLKIAQKFQLDPSICIWIEHYPCHEVVDPEVEFSQVVPQIINGNRVAVTWKSLSRQEAEQICGVALE